jgi:hypothetical protein
MTEYKVGPECNKTNLNVVAQVVSQWVFTTPAQVRSQVILLGICCRQIDNTSASPPKAPYSLITISSMLYNLDNDSVAKWQIRNSCNSKFRCLKSKVPSLQTKKLTSWPETASELHRPSDRRSSAMLVSTFADRGCHVVSVMDPYRRILGFLGHIFLTNPLQINKFYSHPTLYRSDTGRIAK